MIVVAGRPGSGKSTLAMDFARSAAIKHHAPTVIFSLEMSKQDIMMRLFSAEARVKLNDIRSGRMSDDDWRKIALRSSELAEAPLFIDDSPNLTMMEIRAKSRRLKQRHDLKLIVIDYMQLMTSGKRVESRQQEVSEFSRAMKLIAKELEVPVVALSQLNRGPEQRTDKKPMLSDLRESGSIEQDADVVLLVHREDMYERESPRAGEADIIIAKHRNGPTGKAWSPSRATCRASSTCPTEKRPDVQSQQQPSRGCRFRTQQAGPPAGDRRSPRRHRRHRGGHRASHRPSATARRPEFRASGAAGAHAGDRPGSR